MGTCVAVPFEAIAALRRRLTALLPRHPERLLLMDSTAGPTCCLPRAWPPPHWLFRTQAA
jgi:hypothetical protein